MLQITKLLPLIKLNHDIACIRCGWTGREKYSRKISSKIDLANGRWKCPHCGRNDGIYGLDDDGIKIKLGLRVDATEKELKKAYKKYKEEYKKLALNHIKNIIVFYMKKDEFRVRMKNYLNCLS